MPMQMIKELLYRIRGEYTTEKLKKMGMKVGDNFIRLHGVILDPSHCWLISIGNNVTIAPRVHILAHDASTKHALGFTKLGVVEIGDNVFIGAESIILPNVRVGRNVIIGAGSIVAKDLPENGVYAGCPAKFICPYDEYILRNKEIMMKSNIYGEEFTLRKNVSMEKRIQMREELKGGIGFVE
ncbi:MAG: acyltransferase [Bacillota bacterium]